MLTSLSCITLPMPIILTQVHLALSQGYINGLHNKAQLVGCCFVVVFFASNKISHVRPDYTVMGFL